MSTSPTTRPPGDRKLIMAVNDHKEFLELIKELMEEEGYQVIVSTEGDGAYRQIKETMPDLLLLDVLMPLTPPWHVLDLVKLDPRTAKIPVLVCSAAGPEIREREALLRDQGVQVLEKPFGLEMLIEAVERLIGKGAPSV
jgi:CheY-like chemotaxis protein